MASKDDKLFAEAKRRFKRCEEWEADARKRYIDDRKFANADDINGWQWDEKVRNGRMTDERPCLTINKTRQHCLQVINDARQNKPSVDVRATGGGASYKAAEVFECITRHIEYISNAQNAYDRATITQVEGGVGYWRVVTDYADNETLDQEIFIRPVKDPLAIYIDPDIREQDGSDAKFAFEYDDLSHDEFKARFPKYGDLLPRQADIGSQNDWLAKDHVRIARYWRKSTKPDKLISWVDDQGERQSMRASKLSPAIVEGLLVDPDTRSRDVANDKIECLTIVGDKIAAREEWPGNYIPIVRVIGEETVIDGKLDRKGHVRNLRDPQRQYNFWSSGAAEFVALQTKSPFIAPVRAIEGLEGYWETANIDNHSVLPYNDVADDGSEIAAPSRGAPPVMAPAFVAGMQVARQELMEVSGQYQAEMGAPSNERSGKAIQERQRQGDNATYHYIDNLAVAIRFTGKILIDLIPKIYDTPRVIRILAEDGTDMPVHVDPQAPQAYQEQTDNEGQIVARIFNPNVGRYEVQSDIGPDYGTKRQEAFNAIMQLIGESPEVMQIAGDILFKAADFPMADELAERFQRMVPAQALGGPNPEVQQLRGQIQQMQGAMQNTMEALADAKKKQNIEGYRAETDRMALGKDIDPLALIPAIREAIQQAIGQTIPAALPAIGQALQPSQGELQ